MFSYTGKQFFESCQVVGDAIINDYLLKIIRSNVTDPYAPIYILLQFYFECILKCSCIAIMT